MKPGISNKMMEAVEKRIDEKMEYIVPHIKEILLNTTKGCLMDGHYKKSNKEIIQGRLKTNMTYAEDEHFFERMETVLHSCIRVAIDTYKNEKCTSIIPKEFSQIEYTGWLV